MNRLPPLLIAVLVILMTLLPTTANGALLPASATVHTVVRGDTLYSLARHYGTTVDAIMRANHLSTTTIYIGQHLHIASLPTPVGSGTLYTVVFRDTLYSIARRNGTTVDAIMVANKLSSHLIFVGQRLVIPATTTPFTPTVTPLLTASPTSTPTPSDTADPLGTPAQVVGIIDGDTIDVLINGGEYRVRYILVDAPEQEMPYYSEATAANSALVSGQTVFLVKDVSETDRFGRLLRYVYLADGTFVNEELVRLGHAQIATFPPDVAMEATIRAAQEEARTNCRGLWAGGECGAGDGTPTPTPTSAITNGGCDPAYPDVCIPPVTAAGVLDCGDIPQFANFRVLPPDPHDLDGNDNDGLGCESN